MILLSTILTISKRRPEKNSFEIPPDSGIEIRGCPFAPPSWFFRGQLNPESYLPLGQAKFVGKISSQTESKYVFLKLHILYNGTIYYYISLFQHFLSYYMQIYIVLIIGKVDKQKGKLKLCKACPRASALKNRMSTLQVHHMFFRFINLSEMTIQKMTSWNYFEL